MALILVIEDEPSVRENLVDLLEAEGFQTESAKDGEEGVRKAWEISPDLIVCDIRMPRLDGYGVLSRLSQEPATANTPFIFLTARTERTDQREGMELGADDFITKPFTRSEILASVRRRLNKQVGLKNAARRHALGQFEKVSFSMPHELLTPLSAILSNSEVFTRLPEEDYDREVISELGMETNKAAHRLLHLIQDYLLYADLQLAANDDRKMRQMRESRTPDAAEVITELAIAFTADLHRSDDLELKLEDCVLRIAEVYLQKMVEGLLARAFENSPPGCKVHLEGKASPDEDQYWINMSWVCSDSIPGEIGRIAAFDFTAGHRTKEMPEEIAVSLARLLAELHGGNLTVQSQNDKGILVQVSLPYMPQ